MAKVSFIIPVYNTAKYMDQCIKSVIGQTFTDIEIILVDDGSTDGISPSKCDEYAALDPRVRAIHKLNGGLMSAWIAGVKEATSPYLCFVDSDDWVDLDITKELYSHIDSSFTNCEIISSNYIVEKSGERRKEAQSLEPGVYLDEDLVPIRQKLLGEEIRPVTMSRCMKLISKELVLSNIRYCNTAITMSEDVNIMLPCLCDCKRLVILKDSYFYHYRLVGSSMGHGFNPKLLDNLMLTDKTFRMILADKKISDYEMQMDREFVMMLLILIRIVIRHKESGTIKRVRSIFLRPDIRKKVTSTKVDITSKANKLLYTCMKHPNPVMILVTKAIIGLYDKKTNS